MESLYICTQSFMDAGGSCYAPLTNSLTLCLK